MSLLSSSETECYVCGKEVDPEEAPSAREDEDTVYFCCEKHEEQYHDEEQPDEDEVCEFC
ncbi:MAG: hypothetical protein ABEJ07_05150 [Candidatus Nanohaloarchaea archaeon]